MSRFAGKKTKRVHLLNDDGTDSGDWVDLKSSFSFQDIIDFNNAKDTGSQEAAFKFVKDAIRAWNLKDDDGKDVPVSEETILDLDMETITAIMKEFNSLGKSDVKKNVIELQPLN